MNYIIVDLEATCDRTDFFDNEIIEIGAVMLDDDLEQIDEFQIFVKPINNPVLTDFCMELTSIKQSDIDKAVYFDEALSEFRDWIGREKHFLCSWGFYDKKQFEKDCNRYKISTSWLKNHISIKHQHQTIHGLKKGVGVSKGLSMIGEKFDGTHHRGIDDARNIAKIFKNVFPKLRF